MGIIVSVFDADLFTTWKIQSFIPYSSAIIKNIIVDLSEESTVKVYCTDYPVTYANKDIVAPEVLLSSQGVIETAIVVDTDGRR